MFFGVTLIWAGVLLFSNVMFYSMLRMVTENTVAFVALTIILGYGYIVLLEAALFALILLLFAATILCCPRRHRRTAAPIKPSLLEKLKTVKYDPKAFPEDSTCGICIAEYTPESEIVMLPCHAKFGF